MLELRRSTISLYVHPGHYVLEQLINNGNYDSFHPLIKQKGFNVQIPQFRPKGGLRNFGLVSFPMDLPLDEFLVRLWRRDLKPASLFILLQLGATCPNLQYLYRIICGTDFCFDPHDEGVAFIFALDCNNEGGRRQRILDLEPVDRDIPAFTCMLCSSY